MSGGRWWVAALLACACACSDASTMLEPDDGGELFGDLGVDPFADGDVPPPDDLALPGCDDTVGDLSPCAAPAGGSCLTAAICQDLMQGFAPRVAGLAMSCIDALAPDCGGQEIADCVLGAASLACAPAAPGTAPCDTLDGYCGGDDPAGLVPECLALASVMTASAESVVQSCLQSMTWPCEPSTLEACVAMLFPSQNGDQ
jgi:hypothetical protein